MNDISRRNAIARMALGSAAVTLMPGLTDLVSGSELTQTPGPTTEAPAFRGQHQPRPLSFDPAKLKGLSEKLIRSHWENNYGGAVKALNTVEQHLGALRLGDFRAQRAHR